MDEYLEHSIGGETAKGLRFRYSTQGVDMTAESFVIRKGQTLYYLHVYYRTALDRESRETWNTILDRAEWLQAR